MREMEESIDGAGSGEDGKGQEQAVSPRRDVRRSWGGPEESEVEGNELKFRWNSPTECGVERSDLLTGHGMV